jgi:predicted kinase
MTKMKAVITFGLPGSGKTTYIEKHYSPCTGQNIISADNIKPALQGWDEKNPSIVHQESVRLAKELVLKAVHDKVDFVFDSGSINSKYSRNLFRLIKQAGYHIHLIVFDIPVEICLERNRQRSFQVPEDDILAKEREKWDALIAILPMCNTIDTITMEGQIFGQRKYMR